jgi:hypothetical protein
MTFGRYAAYVDAKPLNMAADMDLDPGSPASGPDRTN